MLIGEFAKASGLTRDTIRFYEKIGLISASETRRGSNRYKYYDQALLERMELVGKAKLLGFTLPEIGKLIRDWEGNRLSASQKRVIITDKIGVIDERLRELRKVRQYLEEKLSCLRPDGTVRHATKFEKAVAQKRASRAQPAVKRVRTF
jgi:MerR family Zn(II)-responsive transcriptional regulator of zntA